MFLNETSDIIMLTLHYAPSCLNFLPIDYVTYSEIPNNKILKRSNSVEFRYVEPLPREQASCTFRALAPML